MITLKARPGIRLCRITAREFSLSDVGRAVQRELMGIHSHIEQVKVGHYQIMPDHLHALLHVVRDLPAGFTLQRVIRGFKIGLNRSCRELMDCKSFQVFEKGMHHTLIFDRDHLQRELAYIRDNVRRYRLRVQHPDLFQKPRRLLKLKDGCGLWGMGNIFLLKHPRRLQVQFARNTSAADWKILRAELDEYLEQGYVFVSPFLSPAEKLVLREVARRGGRAIRLSHEFFGPRYKPGGERFDLCCSGRLLELSVAEAFARHARLDRAACLRMNRVAEEIATTQWSQ
jgi:hypothetical protein